MSRVLDTTLRDAAKTVAAYAAVTAVGLLPFIALALRNGA